MTRWSVEDVASGRDGALAPAPDPAPEAVPDAS